MTNRKVIQKVRAKKISHKSHSTPIVFVGAGNLGGAVIKSLVAQKIYRKRDILVITATVASAQRWQRWGVRAQAGDYAAVKQAREIWLAVKPHQIKEVGAQLAPLLGRTAEVISLLAGQSPSKLISILNTTRVTTIMTNTAARMNAGMYAAFTSGPPRPGQKKRWGERLAQLGYFCGFFSEDKMPEITALVGSAPAFLLHLQEQYQVYAAEAGVPKARAAQWFAHLVRSCELLLGETADAALLIRQIATPGGCTERGLAELDHRPALRAALTACAEKAKAMGA